MYNSMHPRKEQGDAHYRRYSCVVQTQGQLEALSFYRWNTAAFITIVTLELVLRLVPLTTLRLKMMSEEANNLRVPPHVTAGTGLGFIKGDWTQAPAFNDLFASRLAEVQSELTNGLPQAGSSVIPSQNSVIPDRWGPIIGAHQGLGPSTSNVGPWG